jgi:hypothetical protein
VERETARAAALDQFLALARSSSFHSAGPYPFSLAARPPLRKNIELMNHYDDTKTGLTTLFGHESGARPILVFYLSHLATKFYEHQAYSKAELVPELH